MIYAGITRNGHRAAEIERSGSYIGPEFIGLIDTGKGIRLAEFDSRLKFSRWLGHPNSQRSWHLKKHDWDVVKITHVRERISASLKSDAYIAMSVPIKLPPKPAYGEETMFPAWADVLRTRQSLGMFERPYIPTANQIRAHLNLPALADGGLYERVEAKATDQNHKRDGQGDAREKAAQASEAHRACRSHQFQKEILTEQTEMFA